MYKTVLGFLFCALAPIFALADSVKIDESGPEGTPPVVTLSAGSTFLLSQAVRPCINPVVPECWTIDIIVKGTDVSSFGSKQGLELTEPGSRNLSDSFGAVDATFGQAPGTENIQFQLFSDDDSGNIGGRVGVCSQTTTCGKAVEDGTFQLSNSGETVSANSLDVFIKSDLDGGGRTPEPATLL